MKVIYLAALGHSGSTWVQSELVKRYKLIGLGEVFQLLHALKSDDYSKIPACSCGEKVKDCEFWGGIVDELETKEYDEAVNVILEYVKTHYPEYGIIDTSKSVRVIKKLYGKMIYDPNFLLVMLARDLRGWIMSVQNRDKRKGRTKKSFLNQTMRWFFLNKRIEDFIKKHSKMKSGFIFYENLVFKNGFESNAIFDNYSENDSNKVIMHDVFGNRMKASSEKDSIKYSTNWFYEFKFYLLFPFIYPALKKAKKYSESQF